MMSEAKRHEVLAKLRRRGNELAKEIVEFYKEEELNLEAGLVAAEYIGRGLRLHIVINEND